SKLANSSLVIELLEDRDVKISIIDIEEAVLLSIIVIIRELREQVKYKADR
ncbi:6125_t:CDS:1, partial [Scutellospora calospora]